MRTFLWFVHFWLYLLIIGPRHWHIRYLVKHDRIEEADQLIRSTVGKWARSMISTGGGTVTVEGLENLPSTPAVYVANHRSYFDIPLILGYLGSDTKPLVAKSEIQKIPLIRGWMKDLHCVFLHRDDPRAAMTDLNEAASWVKAGYSMVIFPEGTRTKTGDLGEFKAGAFRIAQKNHVPVVPVCIANTDGMMPRGTLKVTPAPIALKILPPIDTSSYAKSHWRTLPEMTQTKIFDGLSTMALATPPKE